MNRTKGGNMRGKARAVKRGAKPGVGKKRRTYPKAVRFVSGLLVLMLVVASFNAVIPALIDSMFSAQAANSLDYYPADLTLWDYYDSNNNKVFYSFNKALQEEAYYGTTSYVNAAGAWDSSHQYLFSYKTNQDTYYPLYLGLQYNDSGTSYPWGVNSGTAGTYKYSLAANSNANSGNAAAQHLVDSTLSGGLVTQGNGKVTLPYFNSKFLSDNGIGAGQGNHTFKFKKRTGSSDPDKGYYVYDSSEDGLNHSGTTYTVDPNGTKSPNRSGYGGPTYGFFPLGDYNFGFGAKFDIKFTMTIDGNTAGGDPMKFTFKGDDDVWVFIDDVLVLDIGGAHGQVSGSIDFSNGNTTVSSVKNESAFSFDNRLTNVGTNVSTFSSNQLALLNSIGLYGDPTAIHTMSVFYLERGELESNCKITFNFDPADTLTIENQIDTSGVNPFFQTKTEIVAKHEAMQYHLQNDGANTNLDSPDDGADLTEYLSNTGGGGGGGTTQTYTYSIVYKTYSGTYTLDTTQTGLKQGSTVKVFNSIADTEHYNLESGDKPNGKEQFLGWSTTASSDTATYTHGSVITLPTITSNSNVTITLYAVYTSNTTVTYHYYTRASTDTYDTNYWLTENKTVAKGDMFVLPNSIDNTDFNYHYTLTGWSTTQDTTNQWSGTSPAEYARGYRYQSAVNVTSYNFYAVVESNLHLTYYDSDGTTSLGLTSSARAGDTFTLNNTATKTNKVLLGWSTSANASFPDTGYEAGATVTMTAALAASGLNAVWLDSFDTTGMYYPSLMVVKKGSITSGSVNNVDQKISNTSPFGFVTIESGQIYANYTTKYAYTSSSGVTGNWINVDGSQFLQNQTKVDNTGGDAGNDNFQMRAGYLYLLEYDYASGQHALDKWTVTNGALTGTTESMNRESQLNSTFKTWFIAYGALFEKLQTAATKLTSMQANIGSSNISAYNDLCSAYNDALDAYKNAAYASDGSNTTTLNTKRTALETAITNANNAPSPNSFAPLPNNTSSRSLLGIVLDLFNLNGDSTDNAEAIDISDNDNTDDTDDTDNTAPIDISGNDSADNTDSTAPINISGNDNTTQPIEIPSAGFLLNVNAAGGDKPGHWQGSSGGFADVTSTNFRLKYIDGTASVVRRTTASTASQGGGKFNLAGNQSAKFSLQFERDSGLKLAQTGTSYVLADVGVSTATTATASGSGLEEKSAALSKRYDTTWQITDNNSPTQGSTGTVEGYSSYDTAIPSTNASHQSGVFEMQYLGSATAELSKMVDLTVTYTNTVKVGDLTVSKTVSGDDDNEYDDKDFEFTVKFSKIFGGTGTFTLADSSTVNVGEEVTYSGTNAEYTVSGAGITGSEMRTASSGTITIKKGQSFTISDIPVDTVFSVEETAPTSTDPTVEWSLNSITPAANANVNTRTVGTTLVASVGSTPSGAYASNPSGGLATYTHYDVNSSDYGFTYNNLVTPLVSYLILGKQINHLYYNANATEADSDDPAGLFGTGITVGGQTPTAGGDDMNGYQAATEAKQTFLYQIQVYHKSGSGYSENPDETFYETINFGSGDSTGTPKYRVIKANPTYKYVVTELTDWSWKYELAATDGVTVSNISGHSNNTADAATATATVIEFNKDGSTTINGTEYNYIAQVNYANDKTDDTSGDDEIRDVEGDGDIKQNTAPKPTT